MANPFNVNNMPNNTQMSNSGQAFGINPQAIQQAKNFMGIMRSIGNPQQAMSMLASQNPQFKAVMDMCNGKNPEEVFRAECQRRGINADEIINQLKQ